MKKIFKYTATLLFVLATISSFAGGSAIKDLKDIQFESGAIATLNTDWEFYWNNFYNYQDFYSDSKPIADLIAKPNSWNNYEIKGQKCGSYGYATYRLHLENLPSRILMLHAFSIQTSYRIFINDSLVAQAGTPGKSKSQTTPANEDLQILIPAHFRELDLIIHVSNFHHRKGGIVKPPIIGTPDKIQYKRSLQFILDTTESSALLIIGFFLLALYMIRRKDKSVLYFALFCITLSLRPLISGNYFLSYLLPNINWSLMIKMEYLGVVFPSLFMTLYLYRMFPDQFYRKIVRILSALLLCMAAIVVLSPVSIFSWLTQVFVIMIPAGIVLFVWVIFRGMLAKVEGSKYAGIGIAILFVSLLLKVIAYIGILTNIEVLMTLLDIAFIFSMSLILGTRFSLEFLKVESLQLETANQKQLIEQKNIEILDSIKYAKRLQNAMMPTEQQIKSQFSDSFVFYLPKDIVAGDFYWMQEIVQENIKHVFIAVCDCTGHGVPGAMVSMVCNNALNRTVFEDNILVPGEILNRTRDIVVSEFQKSGERVYDGMDVSLMRLSYDHEKIIEAKWAGANNPLWYFDGEQLKEIKANKQPVGYAENPTSFDTHTIEHPANKWFYLITDGYADQFGGASFESPEGKKFKTGNLKKLLLEGSSSHARDQKELLIDRFNQWKSELEQVDDVCVLAFKTS